MAATDRVGCECCKVAREYPNLTHKVYDPKCIHCGARYLQVLRTWPEELSDVERRAWQERVLNTWTDYGHPKQKLWDLMTADKLAFAPVERSR